MAEKGGKRQENGGKMAGKWRENGGKRREKERKSGKMAGKTPLPWAKIPGFSDPKAIFFPRVSAGWAVPERFTCSQKFLENSTWFFQGFSGMNSSRAFWGFPRNSWKILLSPQLPWIKILGFSDPKAINELFFPQGFCEMSSSTCSQKLLENSAPSSTSLGQNSRIFWSKGNLGTGFFPGDSVGWAIPGGFQGFPFSWKILGKARLPLLAFYSPPVAKVPGISQLQDFPEKLKNQV